MASNRSVSAGDSRTIEAQINRSCRRALAIAIVSALVSPVADIALASWRSGQDWSRLISLAALFIIAASLVRIVYLNRRLRRSIQRRRTP